MNISKGVKVTRCINFTAAGTSTPISGSVIDMKGFDSCTFIVGFGPIVSGGVQSIKVQQGADAALGDAADLLGTSVSVADDDDNQVAIVEVNQPRERYLRVQVLRATQNSTIDFGLALQSKASSEPVTHDSTTVISSELHQAPAEGTA